MAAPKSKPPHTWSSLAEELSRPQELYVPRQIAERIRYNICKWAYPERFVGDEGGDIEIALAKGEAVDELRRLRETHPEAVDQIVSQCEN